MAPSKKKSDDKSQPLAAAAVGAGTEQVQAQAEQKKDGVVLVDPDAVTSVLPDWLLGQFDVKAKSPAGFWRCQVQFLHSSPTRVFVVENKAAVPHDHDCAIPCCYLTPEEAKRVYGDPWLKVLIDSEVIKD